MTGPDGFSLTLFQPYLWLGRVSVELVKGSPVGGG